MGVNKIHAIYISLLVLTGIMVTIYFAHEGYTYYLLGIEERFFNPGHPLFKPGGKIGHVLGITGSMMMIIGVLIYMLRKRVRMFSRLGILNHWLEFHIFLCSLGPVLVLYHTAFKFGGLVAISFWSMVAVVLSGVIGRYIYLQIPRTIEGREMNLNEINSVKDSMDLQLAQTYQLDEGIRGSIVQAVKMRPDRSGSNLMGRSMDKFIFDRRSLKNVKSLHREHNVSGKNFKQVVRLIKNEINLNRKIDRLITMQNLFKYWHVAHLPFALLMLIIMLVHVAVVITFGYGWGF